MGKEIERKFLVETIPQSVIQASELVQIEQGYLAIEKGGKEVRIRKAGDQYTLTVKTSGTLERQEFETLLSEEQFNALWPATTSARIKKSRYILKQQAVTIEIDYYHAPLSRLMVAEVEFASTSEARRYKPEPWMGKEITHLNFLKNKHLITIKSKEELINLLTNFEI